MARKTGYRREQKWTPSRLRKAVNKNIGKAMKYKKAGNCRLAHQYAAVAINKTMALSRSENWGDMDKAVVNRKALEMMESLKRAHAIKDSCKVTRRR